MQTSYSYLSMLRAYLVLLANRVQQALYVLLCWALSLTSCPGRSRSESVPLPTVAPAPSGSQVFGGRYGLRTSWQGVTRYSPTHVACRSWAQLHRLAHALMADASPEELRAVRPGCGHLAQVCCQRLAEYELYLLG